MINYDQDISDLPVGCVASHFLDSGAFSLWTKSIAYGKQHNCPSEDYYDTEAFFAYMDQYAAFVKRYSVAIDFYSNVDAIPNPDITYRNQKYLEDNYGLTPVPVVHYPCDLKWLKLYITEGYEYIALGGMVGSTKQEACRYWIDRAFDMVCDQPSRLPIVKLHGFGVTAYELLIRYPWYSVDSASWAKISAFGGILIPHKRNGKFVFTEPPYIMKVSSDNLSKRLRGQHLYTLSKMEQKIVHDWLHYIQIPAGMYDDEGNVLEHGVVTRHTERFAANLLFFKEMLGHLPDYPWPFRSTKRKGFQL